jgi:catechol 2,3-dioxygenase-like lactoylglutathione lyase family enzyme
MKFKKIDHIGVVVNDLDAAKAFFLDFGLEMQGEGDVEGEWVDQVVGLKDVKSRFVYMRMPDGGATIELIMYYRPSAEREIQQPYSNTPGIRNIAFEVDDIEGVAAKLNKKGYYTLGKIQQAGDSYKLCYIRGPEGIILMLAEPLR